MTNSQHPLPRKFLFVSAVLFLVATTTTMAFPVERSRLPGIWKLTTDALPYEQDIRSKLQGLLQPEGPPPENIWIKLNPDGSFKRCNEGYKEGEWISGRWEMKRDEENQVSILLAMNRQYYGPRCDVVLEGSILQTQPDKNDENNDQQLRVQGQVQKGKFKYPQNHPSFFDRPLLVNQTSLGSFNLEQSVATNSIMPAIVAVVVEVEKEKEQASTTSTTTTNASTNQMVENQFQASDFYNRTFLMTIEEPVQSNKRDNKRSKNYKGTIRSSDVDIHAMSIQFFANNTFQAYCSVNNQILRGRFEVKNDDNGKNNNKPAFEEVSLLLFSTGPSVSGSVICSEGIGLVSEDKRSYLGAIQEKGGRLFVDGSVTTFGADLGSDARRPEPVGAFLLTEETKDNDMSILPAVIVKKEDQDGPSFGTSGVFE